MRYASGGKSIGGPPILQGWSGRFRSPSIIMFEFALMSCQHLHTFETLDFIHDIATGNISGKGANDIVVSMVNGSIEAYSVRLRLEEEEEGEVTDEEDGSVIKMEENSS